MHCHHLHGSAFPIFVACAFGTLAYLCFLAVATRKTTTSADARLGFAMVAPVALFFIAIQYKSTNHHYIGWINLGLSVVSHLCRIESTDYHGEIDRFLLFVSFVGAVNGFLWLIHPQLCLSREYKVNSYIVGVLRGGGGGGGGETFYWCSRKIARLLWKLDGEIHDAAPVAGGNALAGACAQAAPVGSAAAVDAPAIAPGIELVPLP
ncbi:hypothetical protein BS78_03G253600 [Paspalum vaginatum]|nr:hypothetical protein BS78_03G253600 [Paspalum vaginatum]